MKWWCAGGGGGGADGGGGDGGGVEGRGGCGLGISVEVEGMKVERRGLVGGRLASAAGGGGRTCTEYQGVGDRGDGTTSRTTRQIKLIKTRRL